MHGDGALGRWLVGIALVVVVAAIIVSIVLLVPSGEDDRPSSGATGTSSSTPRPTPSGTPTATAVPTPTSTAPVDPGEPLTPVTPFITSASRDGSAITVYGFVPGLGESGGTCRAFIVGGAADESAQADAFVEAGNTSCPPLAVPITASGGTVEVQLEYRSSTSSGLSDPVSVQP